MIGLLVLVQVFDIVWGYIACPLDIKVLVITFNHIEARIFASVDHGVVNVSSIWYFEWHEQVLNLLTIVLSNTVYRSIEMYVAWVWEKCRWRSVMEYGLKEVDFLGVWFEHTVGQSSLFSFDKDLI